MKKENMRNRLTKKVNIVVTVMLALLMIIGIGKIIRANKVIGTYYGTQYQYIAIDGVVYEADYSNDYSSSDRDKLLGKVVFVNDRSYDPMYVWTVKGDPDNEYIYTLWVYDGTFYKRQ